MNYAEVTKSLSKKKGQHENPKPRQETQQNLPSSSSNQRKNTVPKPIPETRASRPPFRRPFLNNKHTIRSTIEISNKLSNFKIEEETIENKKERLQKDLIKFESPFKWKPVGTKPYNDPTTIISCLQGKDDEIKDNKKFKWRKFIIKLVICYELYNTGEVTKAFEKVCELESTLQGLDKCREWQFLCIKDALWHIISASKAFLYLEQNLVIEAEKLMVAIYPVDMMERTHKAGIYGIKAAVFMEFGHKGNLNGLIQALEATKIDRSNPEWHFLVGKCMGRVRRVAQCHELVDPLEVQAISKAHTLEENNPSYKVYLAQVLREKAFRQYKKNYPEPGSKEYKQLTKIFTAAKHKYLEAKELRPDCPHILTRCAYGMCKMPLPFVEFKIIRECLDKAIELAPNNKMTHHVNGLFYERFYVDEELALKELEQAANMGNFGAAIDLVRMHYRLKKNKIIEELEEIAAKFEEPCKKQVAYAQAGSYLLFIKKDIVEAFKFYTKVIEMDLDSYALKSHKPIFLWLRDPVNMFEVLSEELKTKIDWRSFNVEDAKILRKYMIMTRKHIDTNEFDCNKERLTVEKILFMSAQRNDKETNYKRKHQKWKKRTTLSKRWQGNMRSEHKRKTTKKGNSNKNSESFNKSNEINSVSENLESNHLGRGRCNVRKESSEQNEGNRGRTNSNSSVSSVDSDYHRDSIVFGSRSFFNEGSTERLNDLICDTFNYEFRDMSITNSSDMKKMRENPYSRDSSISSMSSNEHSDSQSIGLGFKKVAHASRYSQSQASTTNPSGNESNLSSENKKVFDSVNSNYLRPQRSSLMSVSSAGSNSQVSDSESQSVMERVKQSYRMLSYKSNNEKNRRRNDQKSESSQNFRKLSSSFKEMNLNDKKKNLQRSGSTPSFNTKESTSFSNLFPDAYQPKFLSRDSSVDSSRSMTFMPKFGSNKGESNSSANQ